MTKQTSFAISCTRVLGCLMIVACHFFSAGGINTAAQFLNCAIHIFFFISGYLFSMKQIENTPKWFFNRWVRLAVPEYIYLLVELILCSVLIGGFAMPVRSFIIWFLNLQCIFNLNLEGGVTEHLWFLSFIMLCYLLTPLLQRMRTKRWYGIALTVFLAVAQVSLYMIFRIPLFQFAAGVVVYVAAYFFGARLLETLSFKTVCIFAVPAVTFGIGRLLLHTKADASPTLTALYDGVIAVWANVWIAVFILLFVIWFVKKSYSAVRCFEKPVRFADKISYEIYLVHYMFIKGAVSLMHITGNMLLNIVLVLLATVCYALILHWGSEKIMQKVRSV